MKRRSFMSLLLAAGVAPYVSTMAGVLMPVRNILISGDLTEDAIADMVAALDNAVEPIFRGDIIAFSQSGIRRASYSDSLMSSKLAVAVENAQPGQRVVYAEEGIFEVQIAGTRRCEPLPRRVLNHENHENL